MLFRPYLLASIAAAAIVLASAAQAAPIPFVWNTTGPTPNAVFYNQSGLFVDGADPYGFASSADGNGVAVLQDFGSSAAYFTITLGALTAGDFYDLAFAASSRVGYGDGIPFTVSGAGLSLAEGIPPTDVNSPSPFTNIDAGVFQAADTTATFTFTAVQGSGGDSTGIANVTYSDLPEPATMALLATSVFGLRLIRRRRV